MEPRSSGALPGLRELPRQSAGTPEELPPSRPEHCCVLGVRATFPRAIPQGSEVSRVPLGSSMRLPAVSLRNVARERQSGVPGAPHGGSFVRLPPSPLRNVAAGRQSCCFLRAHASTPCLYAGSRSRLRNVAAGQKERRSPPKRLGAAQRNHRIPRDARDAVRRSGGGGGRAVGLGRRPRRLPRLPLGVRDAHRCTHRPLGHYAPVCWPSKGLLLAPPWGKEPVHWGVPGEVGCGQLGTG